MEYQTSGLAYEIIIEALTRTGVKEGLDRYGMKVHGVWILEPVEIWNESPGPSAGTRIGQVRFRSVNPLHHRVF